MPTTSNDIPPLASKTVRRARAYLMRVAEPPAPALAALIAEHGPVDAAARVRDGDVPAEVADKTRTRRATDLVDEDFATATTVGARLLVPEDGDWPAQRLAVRDPADDHRAGAEVALATTGPAGLWMSGDLPLAETLSSAVAVVGARAATAYGEHVAAEIGYQLAQHGTTVVADGSYGIGTAALRGALNAGGPAVAVLATGIDVMHPLANATLFMCVAQAGLVITEYPPDAVPTRARFATRFDRLAQLAEGVVIVECGRRGGSRRAARAATAYGRPVMAVPGPITSPQSLGTHAMLRDRTAAPVASAAEILETLHTHNRPDPGAADLGATAPGAATAPPAVMPR